MFLKIFFTFCNSHHPNIHLTRAYAGFCFPTVKIMFMTISSLCTTSYLNTYNLFSFLDCSSEKKVTEHKLEI